MFFSSFWMYEKKIHSGKESQVVPLEFLNSTIWIHYFAALLLLLLKSSQCGARTTGLVLYLIIHEPLGEVFNSFPKMSHPIKKFMNRQFSAIVLGLLALSHTFCKHMCGSVINFLYFNSKGWKRLPKKLPLVK